MALKGEFKYDWSKWDPKKTIRENCKDLGIGYTYGRVSAHRLNLSFKKEKRGRHPVIK